METKRNDGGPAFPQPEINGDPINSWARGCGGLSVRDWFAGQALAGYCTRYNQPNNGVPESVAEDAYTLADAMLKARGE